MPPEHGDADTDRTSETREWLDVAVVYAQAEVDTCVALLREKGIPYQVITPGDTVANSLPTSMTPSRIGVPIEHLDVASRLFGGSRATGPMTPPEIAGYESTRDWIDNSPSPEQLNEFWSELRSWRRALWATWAAGVPVVWFATWVWRPLFFPAAALFVIAFVAINHKALSLRCPRCTKRFLVVQWGFGGSGTNIFSNDCLNCHLSLEEISPTP